MSRLRRKKQRRICQGKIFFTSEESAWAAARALSRAKKVNARAYKCPGVFGQTSHWHVTSSQPKARL